MATGTTGARPVVTIVPTSVTAIRAVTATRSIAARGTDFALAKEEERIARCQLDAGTGTRLTVGTSSRADDGKAIRHIDIYRAQDGQSAAAWCMVAVIDVFAGVVVRRSTCRANRRARRGAFGQGRPVCRCHAPCTMVQSKARIRNNCLVLISYLGVII